MAISEMQEMRRRHDDLEQRFMRHEVHVDEDQQKWDNLMQELKLTQATVTELVEATRNLRDSTSDLVQIIEVWRSMNGAIKVGSAVGRLLRWLAGFAVIGAMIKWWTVR